MSPVATERAASERGCCTVLLELPRRAHDRGATVEGERLQALQAIGRALGRADDVGGAMDEVVAITSEVLPVRHVVVTTAAEPAAHASIWLPADERPPEAANALAHALRAHRYLAAPGGVIDVPPLVGPVGRPMAGAFLALPLAVADRPCFGVLLVECVEPPREIDLVFTSALAGELATAIERDASRRGVDERDAARVRQNVLAVVCHDLRSPLSVILLTIASAIKEPANADRRHRGRRDLERIRSSARRMAVLVEDLLDTASIEAGRLALSVVEVRVGELVAEANDEVRPLARARSIRLATRVAASVRPIRADGRRLHQALVNLLANAIKFTPAGGAVVTTVAPATGGAVLVSVRDTGPGIAEADRAHVFEPFWQLERTAHVGTGLGLFIARSIVEAHGGSIWVEPGRSAGATFSLLLPATPAPTGGAGLRGA